MIDAGHPRVLPAGGIVVGLQAAHLRRDMGHVHPLYQRFDQRLALVGQRLPGGLVRDGGRTHMVGVFGKAVADGATLVRQREQIVEGMAALRPRTGSKTHV